LPDCPIARLPDCPIARLPEIVALLARHYNPITSRTGFASVFNIKQATQTKTPPSRYKFLIYR
jgi:hypothetical protein